MGGVRAFIGVFPAQEVVAALSTLDLVGPARWVPSHQWHVTLRFLGDDVDLDGVDHRLRSGLDHSSVEVTAGPRVERLGRHAIAVPVVGLEALARSVDDALGDLTAERDRPFTGHLTLGRVRRSGQVIPLVGQAVAATWTVRSLALVRSELRPEGSHHAVVAEYRLGEDADDI